MLSREQEKMTCQKLTRESLEFPFSWVPLEEVLEGICVVISGGSGFVPMKGGQAHVGRGGWETVSGLRVCQDP